MKVWLMVMMLAVTWGVSHAQGNSIWSEVYDAEVGESDSLALEEVEVRSQRKPFVTRVVDGFSEFFMGCDTAYVTPQKYQFTAQMELSYWHDYYFISSSQTNNSMTIQSDPSAILGGYIYYSILGYGVTWNLNDLGIPAGKTNGTSMRQTFMIHTAKIFAEYYHFNSGKGAEIRRVTNMSLVGKDRAFSGLDSRCNGLNAVYMFNNRHFSWPAAFGENAVQRKSCGSWSIGFQYNHQRVTFDKEALSKDLRQDIDSTLLFHKVNYNDYNVSIGYNYNWVLGRNLLFAVSVMPNVGYRRSNITEAQDDRHSILNNLSTDINLRMSFFWNNTRVFNGLMLETHTYSYRTNKLGLTNTYGTIKYIVGFNFLRKPQSKYKI